MSLFKKSLKTAVFLLIVLGIWLHLSMMFRPGGLHPVYYEPKNTLDAVMIGSSSWYTFWSPMVAYEFTGITSFDYAQGAMPADCLEWCVREILNYQRPRVIALDARMFLYRDENTLKRNEEGELYIEDGSIRNVSDTMPYGLNRFRMLYSIRDYLEDGLSAQLDLLFYHDRWQEVLTEGGTAIRARQRRDYTKGYDVHGDMTAFEQPQDFSAVTDTEALPADTEALLRRLCAYCEKEGLSVVFVAMPTAEHSETYQKKYNYMKQIIGEYDGLAFLNANDHTQEMGLDFGTDLYDATHANYLGTLKFTSWLGDYLIAEYGLEDHRGQEAYGHWQEDLDSWHQMLQSIG